MLRRASRVRGGFRPKDRLGGALRARWPIAGAPRPVPAAPTASARLDRFDAVLARQQSGVHVNPAWAVLARRHAARIGRYARLGAQEIVP
jgi:hypothetical protein